MPHRLRNGLLSLLLPLLCAGCGQTVSLVGSHLAGALDPTLLSYHAYGDSITFGYGLPDPATQVYPALIAGSAKLPLLNYAISGDQACDIPTRQIFPHADSPSTSARSLYSVLISTNDVLVKGVGSYETVFKLCLSASVAWIGLPSESKVMATAATVTSTGNVTLDSSNNWNALVTNAPGATVTFPLRLAFAAPVYLWYRIVDGNPGTFSYALDGTILGSVTTATAPAMQTQNGTTNSLGLLRLPAVPVGTHTLTIVQTSASGQTGVVAVGSPAGTSLTGLPLVLVGTTPRQVPGSWGGCSANDALCQAYIADITAQVALLAGDGLNVRLFDSRKYMTATDADMSDSVHPNPKGNLEIAQSLAEALL